MSNKDAQKVYKLVSNVMVLLLGGTTQSALIIYKEMAGPILAQNES